jgi:FkbM family methyltransferase
LNALFVVSSPVSSSDPPPPKLSDRLAFELHRLAASWRALREGQGVRLRREEGQIRIADAERSLSIPHVRMAAHYRGSVEARLAAIAQKYVGDTGYLPRDGDVIVDVGAGIGEFTLWCAAHGATVLAFEPDPLAFACLRRNVATLAGVQALPFALWKERADLRLHASEDTTESSLIEDGRACLRTADVEAWPLDGVPAVAALPVIDFMKIDGEGVEPEILAGASRTLRRTRIVGIDVSASDRRPNLAQRVEAVLEPLSFRPVAHQRGQTVLALNVAMVGPFSSRVGGLHGS